MKLFGERYVGWWNLCLIDKKMWLSLRSVVVGCLKAASLDFIANLGSKSYVVNQNVKLSKPGCLIAYVKEPEYLSKNLESH